MLSRPGLSKVVRKSCACCVLDISCTTFILGVVGSDCFFLHVPEGFGKILVCANLISRFTCLQVLTFLTFIADISKSGTTQNLSEPTHVQCMNLFAVRFQFLCCCTDGLGGPTLAGTSRDIYFPIYLPRAVVECMILFTHGVSLHLPVQNSRVKRAVPLGPTFSFRDVYTFVTHVVPLYSPFRIS